MGILAVKEPLEAGVASPAPVGGEAPLVPHERVVRRVVLVKGRGADLVLPAQM
jgi:hypothetical protein